MNSYREHFRALASGGPRVNLGKLLRARLAPQDAVSLIKLAHRAGGTLLRKIDPEPTPAPRRGGGGEVAVVLLPAASTVKKMPTHDDGSPLHASVQERLGQERVVKAIGDVFAAGGYRLQPGRNQR